MSNEQRYRTKAGVRVKRQEARDARVDLYRSPTDEFELIGVDGDDFNDIFEPIPEGETALTPEQERVLREQGIREVIEWMEDQEGLDRMVSFRSYVVKRHFFPAPQTREERMEALLTEIEGTFTDLLGRPSGPTYADVCKWRKSIREVLGGVAPCKGHIQNRAGTDVQWFCKGACEVLGGGE